LTLWIFLAVGRIGFNPTDEGFVIAQSHRLLHGEVPHRDFISPRPAASAVLHMLDFALPIALFEGSRLIALGEVVVYSLLFATLVYGIGPRRWNFTQCVGAAAASLVNLHCFPLMAWYTIDGLVFAAVGLVLIETGCRRARRPLVDLGLLCTGIAAITKQSFFAVPLLGLVRIALDHRPGTGGAWLGTIARTGLIAAAPGVAYVAWVGALGGFSEMVAQLGGAAPVWGARLVSILHDESTRSPMIHLFAMFALPLIALSFRRRGSSASTRSWFLGPLGAAVLRTWISFVVIRLTLGQQLAPYPASLWGVQLVWLLAVVVLWQTISGHRATRWPLIALLAMGWMTMLSWGWDVPDLVAGSVALGILQAVWRETDLSSPPLRALAVPLALAAAVAFALTASTFRVARSQFPYRDRPAPELTATLAAVSPSLGGIRTNRITARYLAELVECIRRFPASTVAVIPDNVWVYPALRLRSPFPILWFLPAEIAGVHNRVLASASKLGHVGDYLVLFQTFKARLLPLQDDLEPATAQSRPYVYGSRLGAEILRRLSGVPLRCGTFVGKYAAPQDRMGAGTGEGVNVNHRFPLAAPGGRRGRAPRRDDG
jgi:hypothetical protein